MNERIRELAEQAWKEILDETNIDGDNCTMFSADEVVAFETKFAELIVKECGQWFNDRLVVEPDYGLSHRIERNRAVVGVMKEYNEHFGVE